MALTVIFALIAAFILSITFVPAMIAVALCRKIREKESRVIQKIKDTYRTLLKKMLTHSSPLLAGAALLVVGGCLLFLKLGQEFVPTLDEKRYCDARHTHPQYIFRSIEQNAKPGGNTLSKAT